MLFLDRCYLGVKRSHEFTREPRMNLILSLQRKQTKGAFHLTGKTGIASIATVAVNGKHVAGWRFW